MFRNSEKENLPEIIGIEKCGIGRETTVRIRLGDGL